MSSPNPRLESLYARLEEVLGAPDAATLMTYLPQEPGAQVATKDDIAALGARIDARMDQLDARMDQLDARMDQTDARMGQTDARMDRFERHLEQIDHRFEQMEDRFHLIRDDLRDQMKFYTATTVGAMTALTAIYAGLLAVFV